MILENDRKPYGDYFGRIFRPKYPFGCGRNNLRLAVLHRKASFGRKTPFRPQDPPFRPQDPFRSRLKDPSFGRKTPFRPQDPPFGRKTPFGRILQLRCNWDLSIFRIAVAVKGEKVLAVVLYAAYTVQYNVEKMIWSGMSFRVSYLSTNPDPALNFIPGLRERPRQSWCRTGS